MALDRYFHKLASSLARVSDFGLGIVSRIVTSTMEELEEKQRTAPSGERLKDKLPNFLTVLTDSNLRSRV